jgi:ribosomal-protein-alanine N-acetyltransferase
MSSTAPVHALHTPRLRLVPAHEYALAQFHVRKAQHPAPWDPPVPPDFATKSVQRERLRKAVVEAQAGTAWRWWLVGPTEGLISSAAWA